MFSLNVNGKEYKVNVSKDVTLLWVLREYLKLKGTKYGCGKGLCGSCTVHIDGKAVRSCQVLAGDVVGKRIVTIEGIPQDHPVKRSWIYLDVPQCGYCQPGQIMQAIALLNEKPNPSEKEIIGAMSSNLCRCGTYPMIRKAIKNAVKLTSKRR